MSYWILSSNDNEWTGWEYVLVLVFFACLIVLLATPAIIIGVRGR